LFDRMIWIVLDSVGIGPLPDAADYGDVLAAAGGDWRLGRNTLGHIARARAQQAAPLGVPTLVRLGLASI
jgi:phosphopentomutase